MACRGNKKGVGMWIVASAHERDRYMLVMEEKVLARMDQLMHEKGLAPATVVARLGTREEAMACARQTAAERRERRRRERDEKRNAEAQRPAVAGTLPPLVRPSEVPK